MNTEKRVGRKGIALRPATEPEAPYPLSQKESERKSLAERMDKEGLMYTGRVVVDRDKKFLAAPPAVERNLGERLAIAAKPPEIEFASVPYAYRFFSPDRLAPDNALWSSWSQSTYYSEGKKFYGSVGDHGWTNPHLHLVEYDTEKKRVICLPEINRVLGRGTGQFGDGKIHGFPDMYKPDYLEDPHLWFCTYWCRYPQPLDEDFATGYSGGHIMSYNPSDGYFVDYGVPVNRASWPLHRVDRKRGLLYGLGMFSEFLCWDINSQETNWAGYLPPVGKEKDIYAVSPGMKWYNRCLLVDEHTGMVYSNNLLKDDFNLIKYDPHRNRFFELDITMPNRSPLRCHTRGRDEDGLFWGLTLRGDLYSFDPDRERLDLHGTPWPLLDGFSVSIDSSPGGRYLYFGVASHARGYPYGTPLLQYDKKTKKTKILCFLFPYYYEKYGYIPGGSYSLKLDDEGGKLFGVWNGSFTSVDPLMDKLREYNPEDPTKWSLPHPHDAFGHAAVFVVNIPEQERQE